MALEQGSPEGSFAEPLLEQNSEKDAEQKVSVPRVAVNLANAIVGAGIARPPRGNPVPSRCAQPGAGAFLNVPSKFRRCSRRSCSRDSVGSGTSAALTRLFRGDESRRRRGCRVDCPRDGERARARGRGRPRSSPAALRGISTRHPAAVLRPVDGRSTWVKTGGGSPRGRRRVAEDPRGGRAAAFERGAQRSVPAQVGLPGALKDAGFGFGCALLTAMAVATHLSVSALVAAAELLGGCEDYGALARQALGPKAEVTVLFGQFIFDVGAALTSFRRAELPLMDRGDAAAVTWIIPWR